MLFEFKEDGALYNALSAVSRRFKGIGGSSDPSSLVEINSIGKLSPQMLAQLYRNHWAIQRIVDLLPEDSNINEPEWHLGESSVEGHDLNKYLRNIPVDCPGRSGKGTQFAFREAGKLARLHGDGNIILGIDDGQDYTEAVNEQNIQSIRWLAVRSSQYLYRDPTDPDHYRIVTSARDEIQGQSVTGLIHKSRVINIPGKELPGELLVDSGYRNDSIIQAIFDSFCSFVSAPKAANSMLESHSIFTYKLRGLHEGVSKQGEEKLRSRFEAMMYGLSVAKGLIMDAEKEEGAFINRRYGGVDAVVYQQIDLFCGACDIPKSKLFSSSNSSAFSEGGLSDRYEWDARVQRYFASRQKDGYLLLGKYACLAQDNTATNGIEPEDLNVTYPSILQLTLQEQAQLRNQNAQTDQIYKNMSDVLSGTEIRDSRFSGSEYGFEITLDPTTKFEEPKPEPTEEMVKVDGVVLPISEYEFEV